MEPVTAPFQHRDTTHLVLLKPADGELEREDNAAQSEHDAIASRDLLLCWFPTVDITRP